MELEQTSDSNKNNTENPNEPRYIGLPNQGIVFI